MTQSTPPPPQRDPKFVRDVAKQVDRRRVRRRVTLWTLLLGVVAAAAMYLRCGTGFGLGGGGGSGTGPGSVQPLVSHRCALRISAAGITVDGKPMSRDQAVAACQAAGSAELTEVGDTPEGRIDELHAALKAADVPFSVRDSSSPKSKH
ncbi:MAG TPA: hypothetical protein VH165_23565 [Kofleriaceae bacterium]|jgi:hypothetical protein|nr:hypothetical protein [Kofleriaceae bacterium]